MAAGRLKRATRMGLMVARLQKKIAAEEGRASHVAGLAQHLLRCILQVHINPERDAPSTWFEVPWSAPLVLTQLLGSCWVYNNMAACAWQQVAGCRSMEGWSPVTWVSGLA
jgi:hypothetical protein